VGSPFDSSLSILRRRGRSVYDPYADLLDPLPAGEPPDEGGIAAAVGRALRRGASLAGQAVSIPFDVAGAAGTALQEYAAGMPPEESRIRLAPDRLLGFESPGIGQLATEELIRRPAAEAGTAMAEGRAPRGLPLGAGLPIAAAARALGRPDLADWALPSEASQPGGIAGAAPVFREAAPRLARQAEAVAEPLAELGVALPMYGGAFSGLGAVSPGAARAAGLAFAPEMIGGGIQGAAEASRLARERGVLDPETLRAGVGAASSLTLGGLGLYHGARPGAARQPAGVPDVWRGATPPGFDSSPDAEAQQAVLRGTQVGRPGQSGRSRSDALVDAAMETMIAPPEVWSGAPPPEMPTAPPGAFREPTEVIGDQMRAAGIPATWPGAPGEQAIWPGEVPEGFEAPGRAPAPAERPGLPDIFSGVPIEPTSELAQRSPQEVMADGIAEAARRQQAAAALAPPQEPDLERAIAESIATPAEPRLGARGVPPPLSGQGADLVRLSPAAEAEAGAVTRPEVAGAVERARRARLARELATAAAAAQEPPGRVAPAPAEGTIATEPALPAEPGLAAAAGLPAEAVAEPALPPPGALAIRPEPGSPPEPSPGPTPGQVEAGNFQKAHVRWAGLPLTIETAKGGERVAKDGSWSVPDFPADYGYVKGTKGSDGDHVDIFMGPRHGSPRVWVIDQVDAETRRFDEHKALLGFGSEQEALDTYRRAYTDGKADQRIGAVTPMSVDAFKKWVRRGDTKKPLAYKESEAEAAAAPATTEPPEAALETGVDVTARESQIAEAAPTPIRRYGEGRIPTDEVPEPLRERATTLASKLARDFAKTGKVDERALESLPEDLRPHTRQIRDEAALEASALIQGREMLDEFQGEHADGPDGVVVRVPIGGGRFEDRPASTAAADLPDSYDVVQRNDGRVVGGARIRQDTLAMIAGGRAMDSPLPARPIYELLDRNGVKRNDILTILGAKARRGFETRARVEGDVGRIPESAPGEGGRPESLLRDQGGPREESTGVVTPPRAEDIAARGAEPAPGPEPAPTATPEPTPRGEPETAPVAVPSSPVNALLARYGQETYRGPRGPLAGQRFTDAPPELQAEWNTLHREFREKLLSPLARGKGTLEGQSTALEQKIRERDRVAAEMANREMRRRHGGPRRLAQPAGVTVAREPAERYGARSLDTERPPGAVSEDEAAKRDRAHADARQALDDLRAQPGAVPAPAGVPAPGPRDAGSGVRTRALAVTIPDELERRGWVDLRGQTVNGPRDIATVAQVFRDPRFETFRIYYTKDGQIVAHEGITSRLPDAAVIFTKDQRARQLYEIRNRMQRLGADGYWLQHNHPSGRPLPSVDDAVLSSTFERQIPGFQGHVIIDSGEYGYIEPRGGSQKGPMSAVVLPLPKESRETERYLVPSIGEARAGKLAGAERAIDGPAALASVADAFRGKDTSDKFITLLYSDTGGKVRAVQDMPVGLFLRDKEAADYIRGRQRAFGASSVFAFHPTSTGDLAMEQAGRQLMSKHGVLRDVMLGGRDRLSLYERGATVAPRSTADLKRIQVAEPGPQPPGEEAAVEAGTGYEVTGHRVGPEETPRVEGKAAALKAINPAVRLARDAPRTWESIEPAVQERVNDLLTDGTNRKGEPVSADEKQADFYSKAAAGHLNDVEVQSLDALVSLRKEQAETVRGKLMEARSEGRDTGPENAQLLEVSFDQALNDLAKAAKADVQAGTKLARALAARARVMELTGGAAVPDAFLKRAFKEIPGLTEEQATDLLRVAQERPADLGMALQEHFRHSRLAPWLEAWKAGLVSAPGTQVANVLGNIGEQMLRLGETATATALDATLGRYLPGTRGRIGGEARAELGGLLGGVGKASAHLAEDLRDAFTLKPEKFDPNLPWDRQMGAISGKKGRAIRIPFRLLEAADNFFKAVGGNAELYKLAWREAGGDATKFSEILSDPPKEMLDRIKAAKLERTFQQPNKMAQDLVGIRAKHPWMNVIVPFIQTPANIASATIARSPIGFKETVRAYRALAKAQGDGAPAELVAKLRGAFVDAAAKPLLGTALMTMFTAYAKAGGMTGSGPTDRKERQLLQDTGWQPYSFVVPVGDGRNAYIPYNRFEPVSSLLGIAADAAELKDQRKTGDMFDKAMGSIVQNLISKTYLQGLADAAGLLNDPKQFASQYVTSTAGSLVPNILAAGAKAADSSIRDVTPSSAGISGLPERVGKTLVSRLPGASMLLPEKRGATGERIERPGNALTRFALPIQPTTDRPEKDVERLLAKIGGEAIPSVASRDLTIPGTNGVKVRLTDEEYDLFGEANRKATERIRRTYLNSSGFLRMDPEAQARSIRSVYQRAHDAARQRLLTDPNFRARARDVVREARANRASRATGA
jgi:inorganic pyrophosphatase-like protein